MKDIFWALVQDFVILMGFGNRLLCRTDKHIVGVGDQIFISLCTPLSHQFPGRPETPRRQGLPTDRTGHPADESQDDRNRRGPLLLQEPQLQVSLSEIGAKILTHMRPNFFQLNPYKTKFNCFSISAGCLTSGARDQRGRSGSTASRTSPPSSSVSPCPSTTRCCTRTRRR